MERLIGRRYGTAIATWFCLAALLNCASLHGHKSNERCYTVEDTIHLPRNGRTTTVVKSTKHCYSDEDHPYRYSVLDIPVSLGLGTVRTPEFSAPAYWYWILVQIEKPLPYRQLACMMAVDMDSPMAIERCPLSERLLQADWTAWEDGVVIRSGSSQPHADGKYTRDNIFKFLGGFAVRPGKKYVVEVKFTRDGTPLNVANPHLIVVKQGLE